MTFKRVSKTMAGKNGVWKMEVQPCSEESIIMFVEHHFEVKVKVKLKVMITQYECEV